MSQIPTGSSPERTRRCPEEGILAAFAEHRLLPARQQQVEAHVAACEYCVAQIGFLLELQDADLPEVPATLLARVAKPESFRPRWREISWRWAPTAAALAGVVVVASVLMQREPAARAPMPEQPLVHQQPSTAAAVTAPDPVPGNRTSPPTRTTRSRAHHLLVPQLVEPRAGAVVRQEGFDLRWANVPTALFYEVRLTTRDGRLVWNSKVERNHTRVPPDTGLKPGGYFVWVRAQLPGGKVMRSEAVLLNVQD